MAEGRRAADTRDGIRAAGAPARVARGLADSHGTEAARDLVGKQGRARCEPQKEAAKLFGR